MFYLVILSSLFTYFIFVAIFEKIGKRSDAFKNRIKKLESIGKNSDKSLEDELSMPFIDRFVAPLFFKLLEWISKTFPQASNPAIKRELKFAAIRISADKYVALRTLSMIMGGAFFVLLSRLTEGVTILFTVGFFFFGCAIAIVGFRYYLQMKIRKRKDSIRSQLPDIMDMLSVSVEAGLGFDAALLRVAERSRGALSEELLIVYREIQMGCPRRDALRNLMERSALEELKTFGGAVIQAEQLGISMKNVLQSQSRHLRMQRRQRAEERAMKAPVKMMIPLVLFIFPVIFIILLGPAAINIVQTLGKM